MRKYRLSKEEAGDLLDQRVHVLTSTQELHQSTRNLVKLAGEYLGEESQTFLSMRSLPHHIDRFEQQYNKVFARDPLFGADLMDRIHKRVQVFLHSCNMNSIKDVESGALAEFGGLQKKVERGEWITLTPVWVEWSAQKEERRRKSDRNGFGAMPSGGGGKRDPIFNNRIDPQLRIMARLGDMTVSARP